MLASPQTFSETENLGFWCMGQKQQMFCLFPFASRTFRALGLQGSYPGRTFPGIDKINLALWQTLGYVSDSVFRVHLFMCFLLSSWKNKDQIPPLSVESFFILPRHTLTQGTSSSYQCTFTHEFALWSWL